MTTHIGTFIPLQAQGIGMGHNGLNQGIGMGHNGLNQGIVLGHNALNHGFGLNTNGLGQNLGYGISTLTPNAILEQNPGHSHSGTPVYFVPAFGGTQQGVLQGFVPNASNVAFIPNHGQIGGGSFIPTNTTLHNLGNVATVGYQTGNQLSGITIANPGISQSFATELFENNNEYVLSFDVPGIDIEDLDISLAGNTVYINGIRKDSRESSTLTYSEIAKGNITRAISVPFDVSANKAINTSLENGVLKIRIAKENQNNKGSSSRKVKIG